MVGCEPVKAGSDTPTLLDLVEKSLNQVSRTVEISRFKFEHFRHT